MKADAQEEEEAQMHEINVLAGELDHINRENDQKADHIDQLNGDISALRSQIDEADVEIRELTH